MNDVIVVVPTYNERENIGDLIHSILAHHAWLDILVVDDNSLDGTGAFAERITERCGNVRVTHRDGKWGLGPAKCVRMTTVKVVQQPGAGQALVTSTISFNNEYDLNGLLGCRKLSRRIVLLPVWYYWRLRGEFQ